MQQKPNTFFFVLFLRRIGLFQLHKNILELPQHSDPIYNLAGTDPVGQVLPNQWRAGCCTEMRGLLGGHRVSRHRAAHCAWQDAAAWPPISVWGPKSGWKTPVSLAPAPGTDGWILCICSWAWLASGAGIYMDCLYTACWPPKKKWTRQTCQKMCKGLLMLSMWDLVHTDQTGSEIGERLFQCRGGLQTIHK